MPCVLVVTFHAVWSIHKLTNGEGHDSRVARELLGRGKQIIERVRGEGERGEG